MIEHQRYRCSWITSPVQMLVLLTYELLLIHRLLRFDLNGTGPSIDVNFLRERDLMLPRPTQGPDEFYTCIPGIVRSLLG